MNFIINLSMFTTQRKEAVYDNIFIIVNKFIKMIYYILINKNIIVFQFAAIFLYEMM